MLYEPKLGDEPARLAALARYQVLDTAPEAAFDTIVGLVRTALSVPIAAVSLIDQERQWFKAQRGLAVCETARSVSFCTYTIETRSPLIIHDALADDRFRTNPLVTGAPFIKAYAGIPLASPDGYNIGSLCAIDTAARPFTLPQIDMLRDFARLVLVELELRQRSQRDELTGLLTRGAIIAQAGQELARRDRHDRPAALLMLDIDRFHAVNNALGYAAGDSVISAIATCAAAALRTGDQIARAGGDEFLILLPETLPEEAAVVAERVRHAVAGLSYAAMPGGSVTISIGVAALNPYIGNVDAWTSAAGQLLDSAKQSGRNRCQHNLAPAPLAA
jgi:diguanylate cyclase (GGDEF)-like protein